MRAARSGPKRFDDDNGDDNNDAHVCEDADDGEWDENDGDNNAFLTCGMLHMTVKSEDSSDNSDEVRAGSI